MAEEDHTSALDVKTQIALLKLDSSYIRKQIDNIATSLDTKFLTKEVYDIKIALLEDRISLLQKVVYSTVTLICVEFIRNVITFFSAPKL